jgi:hypothetical protein
MLTVKIIGGLGSQLFQYAYALSLSEKGYRVVIDVSAFEDYNLRDYGLQYYNISLNHAKIHPLRKWFNKGVVSKIENKIGISVSGQPYEKRRYFAILPKINTLSKSRIFLQ